MKDAISAGIALNAVLRDIDRVCSEEFSLCYILQDPDDLRKVHQMLQVAHDLSLALNADIKARARKVLGEDAARYLAVRFYVDNDLFSTDRFNSQ